MTQNTTLPAGLECLAPSFPGTDADGVLNEYDYYEMLDQWMPFPVQDVAWRHRAAGLLRWLALEDLEQCDECELRPASYRQRYGDCRRLCMDCVSRWEWTDPGETAETIAEEGPGYFAGIAANGAGWDALGGYVEPIRPALTIVGLLHEAYGYTGEGTWDPAPWLTFDAYDEDDEDGDGEELS